MGNRVCSICISFHFLQEKIFFKKKNPSQKQLIFYPPPKNSSPSMKGYYQVFYRLYDAVKDRNWTYVTRQSRKLPYEVVGRLTITNIAFLLVSSYKRRGTSISWLLRTSGFLILCDFPKALNFRQAPGSCTHTSLCTCLVHVIYTSYLLVQS